MVEVYRTNLSSTHRAKELEKTILSHFPDLQINFDLEDCDKIFRIVYENELNKTEIEAISKKMGIQINILE